MAWEQRQRGGSYYTRSRKVRGRVIREYIGGGLRGQLAAAEDEAQRAAKEARVRAWKHECARLDAADALVEQVSHHTDLLASAHLIISGYHRHHRGEWRRRRG